MTVVLKKAERCLYEKIYIQLIREQADEPRMTYCHVTQTPYTA